MPTFKEAWIKGFSAGNPRAAWLFVGLPNWDRDDSGNEIEAASVVIRWSANLMLWSEAILIPFFFYGGYSAIYIFFTLSLTAIPPQYDSKTRLHRELEPPHGVQS